MKAHWKEHGPPPSKSVKISASQNGKQAESDVRSDDDSHAHYQEVDDNPFGSGGCIGLLVTHDEAVLWASAAQGGRTGNKVRVVPVEVDATTYSAASDALLDTVLLMLETKPLDELR